MLPHRAAWNTLLDINDTFAVGPADRVLAISSLAFAWTGGSATFAGGPLGLEWGVTPTAVGTFSLVVDGKATATATVTP